MGLRKVIRDRWEVKEGQAEPLRQRREVYAWVGGWKKFSRRGLAMGAAVRDFSPRGVGEGGDLEEIFAEMGRRGILFAHFVGA